MNLLYLSIFGLLLYSAVLIGGKKFRTTCLYALAIGGAVNANYFHAGNYPIDVLGYSFGIDSIIYNLFVFCVIIMLFQYGKKQAYTLSFSSIIAVMFAALYQFLADIFSNGYNLQAWRGFIDFTCSSIASVIVVFALIETIELLRNKTKLKNQYILLVVGMLIGTMINTPIYYTFQSLVNGRIENITELVITSYLGKAMTIIFALIGLYFLNAYDKKFHKEINN